MDKKLGALTAAAAVAGAGAAVVLAKKGAGGQKAVEKSGLKPALRPPIGIRSWGNMRKTARASIIPTATMRPLPGRRSRRAWRTRAPTLWAAAWRPWRGLLPGAGRADARDHIPTSWRPMDVAGGACDGIFDPQPGLCDAGRPGRWRTTLSACGPVPLHPLFGEGRGPRCWMSSYWLNKHDPNYSLCRATVTGAGTPAPKGSST